MKLASNAVFSGRNEVKKLREELAKRHNQLTKDKERFQDLNNKLNQAKQVTDTKESKAKQVN